MTGVFVCAHLFSDGYWFKYGELQLSMKMNKALRTTVLLLYSSYDESFLCLFSVVVVDSLNEFKIPKLINK